MTSRPLLAAALGCLFPLACTGVDAGDSPDGSASGGVTDGGSHSTAGSSSSAAGASSGGATSSGGGTSSGAATSRAGTSLPGPASSSSAAGSSSQGTVTGSSAAPSSSSGGGTATSLPGSDSPTQTCSTNAHWLLGDWGNNLMHPGGNCIECHATHSGAPHYTIAGTVMGLVHDQDDCRGTSGVTVHVVDANGTVIDMTTNYNGNFYSTQAFVAPYSATISTGTGERHMQAEQDDGNCMRCHTADGAHLAPGRIVAP